MGFPGWVRTVGQVEGKARALTSNGADEKRQGSRGALDLTYDNAPQRSWQISITFMSV